MVVLKQLILWGLYLPNILYAFNVYTIWQPGLEIEPATFLKRGQQCKLCEIILRVLKIHIIGLVKRSL